MEKIRSHKELKNTATKYFEQNTEASDVYVTEDGQVFLSENRASLHSREKKFRYFKFEKETAQEVPVEETTTEEQEVPVVTEDAETAQEVPVEETATAEQEVPVVTEDAQEVPVEKNEVPKKTNTKKTSKK